MAKEESILVSQLSNPATRREAFAEVVRLYGERLYWQIRRIVLSHDDADDVLQNTFMKAWAAMGDFHGTSQISTWLYRIAINEALDHLRRSKNKVSADAEMSVANRLMADDYFDGDNAAALLQEAIATLPDVQRTVFLLRYYDEMKYSDMSRILETSEGALKASYHIAVKKISQYVLNHNDNITSKE
ncbi:MAG: RNA polymerase sigma factor [Prevotella sp.]|uniref:RNA polymerase sigma factor n=1 Tax=Prevotella sp. TaxID=59823 RepID=UPI002A274557|nr:RNA polymerase sigma factor [Prevotella sp.]MDD7318299.1 RNA polymerase sigma factor [Prevotellaceae bacterium]MDY4019697.1 RNA polymerase sigma factor [Prevotella sp.]